MWKVDAADTPFRLKGRGGFLGAALCLTAFFFAALPPVHAQTSQSTGARVSALPVPLDEIEKDVYHLKPVHPYDFSLTILQKSMASLGYQKRTLVWSKTKRVFSDAIIKKLAPRIREAFRRATPRQVVAFKAATASGRAWLEGDTFLTRSGLHWRLTRIHKMPRSREDFSIMGASWKLVLRPGQTYQKRIRTDLNDLEQEVTSWVVLPGVRVDPSRILEIPADVLAAEQEDTAKGAATIKKRLEVLEELRKDRLIDEQEYRTKRRKILDEL